MEYNGANAYPRSEQFDYFTKFEMINFDEECRKDLTNGHGFIIKEPQPINKALKSDDSIFSSKYNKFDILKRLLNKVDEYNKISIASIDIEDKYDYVKCVILGADLVDYNFKITTKEIKHAFISTMCLSKTENLKQLKEIKYIEE